MTEEGEDLGEAAKCQALFRLVYSAGACPNSAKPISVAMLYDALALNLFYKKDK